MSNTPRALVAVLETSEEWNRAKEFFRQHDVEKGDDSTNAYDLRDEEVYYWGRDGWRKGFHHAVIYRVPNGDTWNLIAESSGHNKAGDVLRIAREVAVQLQRFMGDDDAE